MVNKLLQMRWLAPALFAAAGVITASEAHADGLASEALRQANAWRAVPVEAKGQIKFVARTQFYGRTYYRCRRFSFHCGFTRGRLRYRSTVVFRRAAQPGIPGLQAVLEVGPDLRPVRSTVAVVPAPGRKAFGGRHIYNGLEVRVLEYSGGFARISAPSQVTRWVRADAVIPLK